MALPQVTGWIAIAALVGTFVYWSIKERRSSKARRDASLHGSAMQRLIRIGFPLLGLILALQFLGFFHHPLPLPSGVREAAFALGFFCFWVGLLIAFWARESLGLHWAHAADLQVIPGQALVTDGPYGIVRHPIYTALLIQFLGAELMLGSWFVLGIIPLTIFVVWQVRKEEQILERAFGDVYRTYQRTAGMFFPRLSSTSKTS